MPTQEPTNLTTHECSRCGDTHTDLPIRRMARPHAPPEAAPLQWTHWATCPTTGDPILILLTPQSSWQTGAGVWYGGETARSASSTPS